MAHGRKVIFTWIIIAVNAAVMFFMYLDGYASDSMTAMRFGAIIPELVAGGEYWRLFSSMFVHFGFTHLLVNMGSLLIVGFRVEKYLGYATFLITYFVSGLVAAICSYFFTQGYAAGASGAIFGLDGLVLAYTHITKRPIEMLTNQIILMQVVIGVGMGFTTAGVDNAAHVGGLLTGLLIGWAFTKIKAGSAR